LQYLKNEIDKKTFSQEVILREIYYLATNSEKNDDFEGIMR
jgi:hypothetical protein